MQLDLLERMLLIRRFEERAGQQYGLGKIGGFFQLYIGQEAVAVGALTALRPDDYALAAIASTAMRSLAAPSRAGCWPSSSPRRVLAELRGKATGTMNPRRGGLQRAGGEDQD